MPISITSNTISNPGDAKQVQAVIEDEFRDRLGEWAARILEPAESPAWYIRIKGPEAFKWEREFEGPLEQDSYAAFLREKLGKVLLP